MAISCLGRWNVFPWRILGRYSCCLLHSKSIKKEFWESIDFVAPCVPFGLGAGTSWKFHWRRTWGRPTEVSWGMIFPHVDDLARHPSQLYELALEGIILFIIVWWFSSKQRPRMAVSGVFAFFYGVFRFFIEFFRSLTFK